MTEPSRTAQAIFDSAPLGAIIRYQDGTPKPPARFNRKVQAWERFNGTGQLVKKEPASQLGTYERAASFTLFKGDLGSGGIVVLKAFETFSVTSRLQFHVTRTPPAGSVRILTDESNGTSELIHLAPDQASADGWMARNPHHAMRAESVSSTACQRFTYLQDPGHGWLLVTRQDLAAFGMSPGDFTPYSYVSGERLALEEDLDMGRFLQKLEQLGVPYELDHQHINQSAYVRNWMSNAPSAASAA